jgi:hypothetical protein
MVTAGQTYFIIVDGYTGSCGGSSGAFTLTMVPDRRGVPRTSARSFI